MADTTIASALTVEQWETAYIREWMRRNKFHDYMGKDINKPIIVNETLGKVAGTQVHIPLLTRLQNAGVTGDNTLEGNEEALGNYDHAITVDQLRHAVVIGHMEQQKTEINMLKAASPALLDWDDDKLRDEILAAAGSANVDGSTAYGSCSEANKDAWLAANDGTVNRVLFGNAKGNQSTTDHSASLLNVDSTNDTLDTGILSLAKRMIKQADPRCRPVRFKDSRETYVAFVGSLGMRDLRAENAMQQANRDARERGESNPLFQDGDLLWEDIVIHEIPEIDVISGVGNGTIDVEPWYLLGSSAIGVAIGEKTKKISDSFDYGNKTGVGVACIRGVDKLMHNSIQHGMLTGYVSGVADS
jgi:N4-gp56 family major capsid protein